MTPLDPGQPEIVPAEGPSTRQLLNVVLAATIAGALYLGREFLIPLTLSVLLAFVLAPLVQLLRRSGLPRVAAVLVAVSLSLALACGAGAVIGAQLGALLQEMPQYQKTVQSKVEQVSGLTTEKLEALRSGLAFKSPSSRRRAGAKAAAGVRAPAPTVQIYQPPPTPFEVAGRVASFVMKPVATAGLVFVIAVFILFQQTDLRDRIIRLIGASDLHRTTAAMDDAAGRLSRYFLSQVGVNSAFGFAFSLCLVAIGVPHSVLWGVVAALLRFIPFVGGLGTVALATSMAAAVDPGWSMVAWTVGVYVVIELVTSQVVEPYLYGQTTGLSPVSIVVAAVFWTWLWGPIGLLLSTPLSLCLLVLGRHVPQLEFVEILLGDRPPLTPVETFYQRMLSGDAEEALQQAEGATRESSLAAYFDEIALRGLLLAASDASRGVLKRDKLSFIRTGLEGFIGELADQSELRLKAKSATRALPADGGETLGASTSLPTPSRAAPAPVICIGGPGVLDDLAATMLVHTLSEFGITAKLGAYRAASRERIAELNLPAFGTICVVHLLVADGSARLRSLLSRIHNTAPSASILLTTPHSSEILIEDFPGAPARGERVFSFEAAAQACLQASGGPVSNGPGEGRLGFPVETT